MSVDLKRLPADEETLRMAVNIEDAGDNKPGARLGQNILDGLNWFRCTSLHNEQALTRANAEITRLNAELIEVRNSAHHNRIFGGHA